MFLTVPKEKQDVSVRFMSTSVAILVALQYIFINIK
jgi:hypothetical protein